MTYCKSYQYISEVLVLKDASSWLSKAVDLTAFFLATPKINWCFTTKKMNTLPEGRPKNFGHVRKNDDSLRIHQMLMVCSMDFFHGFFPVKQRNPSENSGARPRHFQASWGSRRCRFGWFREALCPSKNREAKSWKICESMWIYVNLCESMWIYVNLAVSKINSEFCTCTPQDLGQTHKKTHTHSAGSQAIVLGKWSNPYGILNKLIWAVYLMSMGFSGS